MIDLWISHQFWSRRVRSLEYIGKLLNVAFFTARNSIQVLLDANAESINLWFLPFNTNMKTEVSLQQFHDIQSTIVISQTE